MTLLVPTNRRPTTPGAILREDFLEPLNLTQGQAADALGVDRTSLNELLNGRRTVTTEMALRLARVFGTTPLYWLNLQVALDLFDAQQSELVAQIEQRPILVGVQAKVSIFRKEAKSMTSERVVKKASKLLRKAKRYPTREVAGSDLAQTKRRRKTTRKTTRRTPRR